MHGSPKILLVEDEPSLQYSLKFNLEAEGFEVVAVGDGQQALKAYNEAGPFSLVVLDVMLPELDGFAVAKAIRSEDLKTGILMLTARAATQDRIEGLQSGADDYLTKPFHLEELLLRVKRMADRSRLLKGDQAPATQVIHKGPFSLDTKALTLQCPNGTFALTVLESDCLKEFLLNPGSVLSREYLLKKVWGVSGQQETRTVDNFIMRIRKFLEVNPKQPQYLESIRGRGYRLNIDG